MVEYVALLRAIAHVPMLPFRQALEDLGFTDVSSYGMSGNLLFNGPASDITELERRISERLSAVALVRSLKQMEQVVEADPFRGKPGAAMMFLADDPDPSALARLLNVEFEAPPPLVVGRTIYLIFPARPRGRRTSVDFERTLGVVGTARSSRVVSEILRRMSA